ncbi:MAG: hypothetical protein ACLQVX_23590 [Limisphaerales bacterium]
MNYQNCPSAPRRAGPNARLGLGRGHSARDVSPKACGRGCALGWLCVGAVLGLPLAQAPAQGIPEPSLVLYGSVLNAGSSQPLNTGQVTWRISNQTDSVSVTASIVGVNTQFFYIAFIPLETRTAGGQTFPASTNTLGLPAIPTTCARSAMAIGTNATIVFSSLGMSNTFALGPGSRGLIERVDLAVGTAPAQTFAQWLAGWGLAPTTDPNADPLGKGMTYYQQFIAGTNPLDKNSVFDFVDIQPTAQGLNIVWTSFSGRLYTLESSPAPGGVFAALQQHIAAAPPVNTFTDTTATGHGPRFYRVLVEQP